MPDLSKLKEKRDFVNKTFKHCFLQEFNCYNVDTPDGRYYVTPSGDKYPSVTTFLSALDTDTTWLDKWAEKLGGKDKADAELKRCGDRGTAVHLALECLARNTPDPELARNYKSMYNQIANVLSIHVDDIYALELPLWSKVLQLAGRVDCIARYKGELCIIDFKTSSRPKIADWIGSYFEQTTCYAIMAQELYGIKIDKIVIMVAVENGSEAQVFVRNPKDYYLILSEHIKEFRRIQKNKSKIVSVFEDFSV